MPESKPKEPQAKRNPDEERAEDIAAVIAEETSDDRIPGGGRRYWQDDGLGTAPVRGRHDQGYVPRGYARVDEVLFRPGLPDAPSEVPPNDRVLMAMVIEGLGTFVEGVEELPPRVRDALRVLFGHLHGHAFGEPWQRALAELLREQAEARECARMGVEMAWPPAKARTPSEILDLLRQRIGAKAVPGWLNASVIEVALCTVNLGGGGGRGKRGGRTPEQTVKSIANAHAKGLRKPRC